MNTFNYYLTKMRQVADANCNILVVNNKVVTPNKTIAFIRTTDHFIAFIRTC